MFYYASIFLLNIQPSHQPKLEQLAFKLLSWPRKKCFFFAGGDEILLFEKTEIEQQKSEETDMEPILYYKFSLKKRLNSFKFLAGMNHVSIGHNRSWRNAKSVSNLRIILSLSFSRLSFLYRIGSWVTWHGCFYLFLWASCNTFSVFFCVVLDWWLFFTHLTKSELSPKITLGLRISRWRPTHTRYQIC